MSFSVRELLEMFIRCESVNPNRRPFKHPPFGEEVIVELLKTLLDAWGAKVKKHWIYPGRPNLLAKFVGKNPHKSLLFEAHTDTVQVEGMTIPPFDPEIRDGKLYGRGACDDKGPMAAMIAAIKKVIDEDGKPPVTLFFAACCDEELGAGGSRALMESGFRADAAIVAEPTELKIIHALKGAVRWKITTIGKSGHSSAPDMGVNAISKMMMVMDYIEGPAQDALKRTIHHLLGTPTLSVGTITGGSQVNIIPGECTIEVDRRMLPGESAEKLTSEINQVLSELMQDDPEFRFRLEETEKYPAFEENTESLIAETAAGACRKILGEAVFDVAHYAADAGVFKEAGIPCVLFGPGSLAQAHTKDEYIELDQLQQAADVYAEIIRTFQ
jgi:acetylornithine deacetylase/succinyl-diaminopimelate desuccinylase family protein